MVYRLHDLSTFPFVVLKSDACVPGFSEQWGKEMTALVEAAKPFVVAFEPAAIKESAEDFKSRAQWFKHNRHGLGTACAGMVAVVPSDAEREEMQAALSKRSRGLGVTYLALASFDAAASASVVLLRQQSTSAVLMPTQI